jgi:hypothetical protein
VIAPKAKRQALKAIGPKVSSPKRCGIKPSPHISATNANVELITKGEGFMIYNQLRLRQRFIMTLKMGFDALKEKSQNISNY